MKAPYKIYVGGVKKPRRFVVVDRRDYIRLVQHKWQCSGSGYAYRVVTREGKRHFLWLHKEVVGADATVSVDHRDRNSFNCRRRNLRICTHAENVRNHGPRKTNTSGFKGVSPTGNGYGFQAYIQLDRNRQYLGFFKTPEAAARAYDAAARELHGEFAFQNFPTRRQKVA